MSDDLSNFDLTKLTQDERSVLVYAETCLINHEGLLEGRRMNNDDIAALEGYQKLGILTFGRIPFSVIEEVTGREHKPTHWITFSDRAWEIAHALRRLRAKTITSGSRQKVDEALAAREQ